MSDISRLKHICRNLNEDFSDLEAVSAAFNLAKAYANWSDCFDAIATELDEVELNALHEAAYNIVSTMEDGEIGMRLLYVTPNRPAHESSATDGMVPREFFEQLAAKHVPKQ